MPDWDVIVIGAGSAGAIVAARLAGDPRRRVLLLEAGGTDRRPWVMLPIGYGHSFHDPAVNWRYTSIPQPGLGGRTAYVPRGRVLGGSSSINAMVWVHGQPGDFEDWKAAGNPGWGWADVAPVFRRIEAMPGGDPAHRGRDGPLPILDMTPHVHPLSRRFLSACAEAGIPTVPDYNRPGAEGACLWQITQGKGLRASAATAFLRPAMARANLSVVTHALAERLVLEGRRVAGVEYRLGRRLAVARAPTVVLAAGAIGSPLLLQRSGLGPAALLARLGIPVLHDLPGVGARLQDHLGIDYLFRATVPTLNTLLRPFAGRVRVGLRYLLFRDGPLALSVNQAGGFVREPGGAARVTQQLYFTPLSYSTPTPGRRVIMEPDPFPGFALGTQPCRPLSRGRVEITAPDPAAPPLIDPGFLSDPADIADQLAGVRLIRRLAATPALRAVTEAEMQPGPGAQSEADLVADIRARAGSVYHPVGTCGMGPDPRTHVVDHRLRVHGIAGLRVIDASVFPNLTSGNTNAPAMMVGMKGADMLLDDLRTAG